MKFSIDPNPIGAFIEYTLKPLIDDAHELLDKFEENGLKADQLVKVTVKLYIFDKLMSFITQVTVTSLLCLTIYFILSGYLPTTQ